MIAYQTKQLSVENTLTKSISDWGFLDTDIIRAEQSLITVNTGSIVILFDGVNDPTPTFGHIIASGVPYKLDGNQSITDLKAISQIGTSLVTITLGY